MDHPDNVHKVLDYLILLLGLAGGTVFLVVLLVKSLFYGLKAEDSEDGPPLYPGDNCPECLVGILRARFVKANPEKVRVRKEILVCSYCYQVYKNG